MGKRGDRELPRGWVRLTAHSPLLNLGLSEGGMQPVRPRSSGPPYMKGLLLGGGTGEAGLPDLVPRGWRTRAECIIRKPSARVTVWDVLTDKVLHQGRAERERGLLYRET